MRNRLFWILDSLKGGKIKRHLTDLSAVVPNFERPETKALLQKRLHSLLHHAVSTTGFYSNLKDFSSITDFPVADKNLIRENTDKFISDRFQVSELVPAITSGSTGTPFKTYQDKNKKLRNSADTIYFASLGGFGIGDKLYYFKIWSTYNRKSAAMLHFQNIVPIDVLNLQENCGDVLQDMASSPAKSISMLGYVSAFETLCKYMERNNFTFSKKVNSIITMSESLNQYTKEIMGSLFSCPVLSRYSNIENGILAQQTLEEKQEFIINTASYYIEVLDINVNTPVPFGELGRIVVTDYYNYGMPMIRYDTGDLGVMTEKKVNGRTMQVLSKIEGRKLDQIFNSKGELISSYIVYKNMWNYTEIDQYQFVQRAPKEFVFKVCIKEPFLREAELIKEFKDFLGQDAIFSVEYVQEIPLLASGKRKKVVNEFI